MSLKTPEQVNMQPTNGLLSIGNTACRIEPLSKRMDAITETPDTSCTAAAPFPDFEIELLAQHGIEGIHIYFN